MVSITGAYNFIRSNHIKAREASIVMRILILALLLPVSLSLTNHLGGVLSHVGRSLVISFCLLSRHHGNVKTAVVVVSAEKSRRRNGYGRGLDEEQEYPANLPTNLPTILSRNQRQNDNVENKSMKNKPTKSPASSSKPPSKGATPSSDDDVGECAVDTTLLNDATTPGVTALEYLGVCKDVRIYISRSIMWY